MMWFTKVKQFYNNGHPAYTKQGLKKLVVAKMITQKQYKEITNTSYKA